MNAQDDRYREAAGQFGPALIRLARAYENNAERQKDLLQEIHLALWRSFAVFEGGCSLRTWTYRVAHAAAATYVIREKRQGQNLWVGLEEIESEAAPTDADRGVVLGRLVELIQRLKPLDRAVILGYLEGLDAAEIASLTGLSAGNVATKISRIKDVLAQRYEQGGRHGG